jgi:CelD/BcsL family acetyltransferase involved in cellulose biosynthesis
MTAGQAEAAGASVPAFVHLPITDPRWTDLVEHEPEGVAFHTPAWAEVLTESHGLTPFVLARIGAGGKLLAGMPVVEVHALGKRRWVSLPLSDVCPPLGDAHEVEAAIAALSEEMRVQGVDGVEIRSGISSPAAHRTVRGIRHVLELVPDADNLLPTFSRSQVRRNIARAQREGVVVRRADRRDDLLEIFLRLHELTRRRHGLFVQPRRFFECLWEQMIAPGHGFVLIAMVGESPAAAAVFLLGGRTVTYQYGASDPQFWSSRANHLLFWESIRWSSEHQYRLLDFGRSDVDNHGLRAFKSGWGTEESELVYSVLGTRPIRPPEALVGAIGPLIRHSPLWANRLFGRVLYRLSG